MAKFIFQAGVFFGSPLFPGDTSTQITVYDAETDLPVETLWEDEDGIVELSNPFNIAEEGHFFFYADAGKYNVVATMGVLSRAWSDVILGGSGGGSGTVETIVAGAGISVDNTDPANPIVTATGTPFDREVVQTPSSSSGILTIDCDYYYHDISLTEDITSIVFENLPGSGKGRTLMLFFYQDSTPRTVAWPTSFVFTSGSETEVATGSGDESVLAISTATNGFWWAATMQYGGA